MPLSAPLIRVINRKHLFDVRGSFYTFRRWVEPEVTLERLLN